MFKRIKEATDRIAEKYSLDIIPSGDAVELARKLPEFDESTGGVSLNRDGFHLSLDCGRYLAGLVLYSFFTKKAAKTVTFIPEGVTPETARKLKGCVDSLFEPMS